MTIAQVSTAIVMMQQEITPCKQCGKKTSRERTDPSMPKEGHECAKCHEWVCGECTDWTASEVNYIVCSRCSGRTAPHKSECE